MKITPYSFFLSVATLVALISGSSISQVHAFGGPAGSPFSNGGYFPNDGTFSAVIRGENLSGTVQFSTSSGAGSDGAGSTGVSTIYYNGDTYYGNSQGAFDSQSSSLSVTFQAGAEGQGEQQFDINTIVNLGDTITTTTTVNSDGSVVTQEVKTPNQEITPQKTITYFDSLYLNGSAVCRTSNSFPNQKFSGTGMAEFQYLNTTAANTPFLDVVEIPISVSGVRLSNTTSTFTTTTVRPPSVNVVTTLN